MHDKFWIEYFFDWLQTFLAAPAAQEVVWVIANLAILFSVATIMVGLALVLFLVARDEVGPSLKRFWRIIKIKPERRETYPLGFRPPEEGEKK